MDLHFDVLGAPGPRRYFAAQRPQQLAHAYLFSGPPGVGKKTFARRLAQSLFCAAPKERAIGYDGTCTSCLLFEAESARHPDFLEHAGTLKIGDAGAATGFHESDELSSRDVVRLLSLQSYAGGMRVLLLGDVEFATHEAANALLKFVEEPPPGVLIIMTTAAPGTLLTTIRSRVVELRFPPLAHAHVVEILLKAGHAHAEAEMGASLAGGSARRALAALAPEEESLRAQVVRWFFESVQGRLPAESWASRETLDDGLETIKTLVRDWVVAGTRGAVAPIASDQAERVRGLRPLSGREAAEMLATLDRAQRFAQTNLSPGLVSDFVRMALSPRVAS